MKYVFVLISLLFSFKNYGQIDIVNRSLTDTTLNLLYTDADNAMEIKGLKCSQCTVTIIGSGGWVQRDGQNRYRVRVHSVSDSCTLIVYNNTSKKALQKNFKTLALPPALAALAGQRDTSITIGRILANPFLNIIFPQCYLRMYIRVVSFKAIFIHDTDSTFTENGGYMLTAEQVQIIKTSRSGDKIYFDEIYALGPDDKRRHMPSFWIKIE